MAERTYHTTLVKNREYDDVITTRNILRESGGKCLPWRLPGAPDVSTGPAAKHSHEPLRCKDALLHCKSCQQVE